MKLYSATLLIIALGMIAITAEAGPSCELDSGPKLYRLELTVPASFCSGDHPAPSCAQSGKQPLIQLHGLWPNYETGKPPEGECSHAECPEQRGVGKFCSYPAPAGLYGSETWKRLSNYMTGTDSCLERHEWVKHGLCTSMSPVSYFSWALQETQRIVTGLSLPPNESINRRQFDQLVKAKLPDLDGAVRVTCRKDLLLKIYVLYEWGNTPGTPIKTKGGTNGYGNCPSSFMVPDHPLDGSALRF